VGQAGSAFTARDIASGFPESSPQPQFYGRVKSRNRSKSIAGPSTGNTAKAAVRFYCVANRGKTPFRPTIRRNAVARNNLHSNNFVRAHANSARHGNIFQSGRISGEIPRGVYYRLRCP
jgi:hypothetical protein